LLNSEATNYHLPPGWSRRLPWRPVEKFDASRRFDERTDLGWPGKFCPSDGGTID
jgi:hypothetical protein